MCARHLFAAVLIAIVAVGNIPSALANLKAPVTTEDVIKEVSDYTGIAADTLQAVRGQSPAALDKLKDTVTALRVVDLYAQARDSDALMEIYEWQKGKLTDRALGALLPQNMVVMIAAVRAYKAALEAIRDDVFIPALEESVYQRYKAARGGKVDWTKASPDEAYDVATVRDYYPAKQKMFDELIRERRLNPKLMGPRLEADTWRQIDAFWKNRLETRYLQESVRNDHTELILEVWRKAKPDLDRLRQAVKNLEQPQQEPKKPVTKSKEKPPTSEKATAKPVNGFKELENLFKGLAGEIDKSFGDEPAKRPTPAARAPAPAAKPAAPTPAIKSGQVVQSCAVCGPAGMDCECGSTTCVCCSRGQWCWPK